MWPIKFFSLLIGRDDPVGVSGGSKDSLGAALSFAGTIGRRQHQRRVLSVCEGRFAGGKNQGF